VYLRAIGIWVLLALFAVLNGTFRNSFLTPRLGELRGHVISTIVLCLVILAVTMLSVRWIRPGDALGASLIGLLWVAMTLSFEFVAGHFLFGNSWESLLADYRLWQGRLWILVPVVTYMAPVLAHRLRMA